MTELVPNDTGSERSQLPHLLKERDFYGHPPGLWVLTITEAWLAFSLYGMLSLLVLYMSKAIFIDDHSIASIWGLGPLLELVKVIYAPVGMVAIAGGVMGLFLALIFVFPLLGSFLADRFLGRTRTIFLGAVLMTLGDGLLCFKPCFVLALVCLMFGNGCVGSMKAQVGALYALDDRRRSDAYQIYTLGVQIAVIIAPILCATLNEKFAWQGGFLTAACGMGIGILCYLWGRCYLPPEPLRIQRNTAKKPKLTRLERQRMAFLIGLIAIFAIGALPNEEMNDGYILWANQHYHLAFFGYAFPVSYLMSLDAFISTLTTLGVLWGLQAYEKHYGTLQEIIKISFGNFICSLGPLCLALGSWFSPGMHQVSLWWGVLFHTLNDIGFSFVYSIGMALFSRVAPARFNTVFVSLFMLHLFLANLFVGKCSTLLSYMSDISFWLLHSGASFLAAVLFMLCAFFFHSLLRMEEKTGTEP